MKRNLDFLADLGGVVLIFYYFGMFALAVALVVLGFFVDFIDVNLWGVLFFLAVTNVFGRVSLAVTYVLSRGSLLLCNDFWLGIHIRGWYNRIILIFILEI